MFKKIIKGIMAGFLIGLAGSLFILAKSQGYKVLPALLFPIGLFLICLLQFNLFTGKVGFFFNKEKHVGIINLLIMLVANAVGAILFGLIFTVLFKNSDAVKYTALEVINGKFGTLEVAKIFITLLKASLCGMMVYLGVYLFGKGENIFVKGFALWIPIFVFVYLGLDHSIANIFYLSMYHSYSLNGFVYILIAVLGNSLGAILTDLLINKID